MTRNDIIIKETGGLNYVPTSRWITAAGALTLIKAGEPAKQCSATTGYMTSILLADADFTIATDKLMTGIGATDSTDVVGTAGISNQYELLPNIKWEIKAKTATNVDTQAEIDQLSGYAYLIDLATTVFTMDMAGATAAANAFVVEGGDPSRSTVWFRIRPDATIFGGASV